MLYAWTCVKLSTLYLMKSFLVIFGHLVLLAHCGHDLSATLLVEYNKYPLITPYQDSVLLVVSGVNQGSILGPLLFLVYMNNISSNVEASRVLKFADDIKCFMTISCDEDHIKLQQDIDSIILQISLSHLTISYTKCVHVPFKLTSSTSYLISNTEITCQNTNKDLGVIVSSDLKWSNHYNFIIPKAYKPLALIWHTFLFQALLTSQTPPVHHISSSPPHLLLTVVATVYD